MNERQLTFDEITIDEAVAVDESAAAHAARDEGIERAHDHALESWKREALTAIYDVARDRTEFVTDAVWYLLDLRQVPPVREPRALAGVLKEAQKRGWIVGTGIRVNSKLKRGHARPVQVYRSRIFR